ncbi:MAG: hydratase [Verrucomicrobia bacterium]|nr:hydratase [Verrucomicrobiota bacterium]
MKPSAKLLLLGGTLALLAAVKLFAASPTRDAIHELTADYLARRPSQSLHAGMTLAEARPAQKNFVKQLMRTLGRPIGFKVGLISKAAQAAAGTTSPARGVLLEKMLLPNGAQVSARFGSRPLYEPDLIVVVKDASINDAKTPLDVAKHLREIVAFIELPDRIVAESEKVDGSLITAINVGARLGVLGDRVKVQPTAEFVEALEKMVVTATDEKGTELARADGKSLMGNPLNVVLWLLRDLAATGEKLKPGDLLSLGTFAPPKPPTAGQSLTVRYEGLPGGPLKVSARFTP